MVDPNDNDFAVLKNPSTVPGKEKRVQTLINEIAALVSDSGDRVFNAVRDLHVQREIDARASLVDKGIQRRAALLGELKKVDRPDLEGYDSVGNINSSSYSKNRLGEIRKAREAVEKLDKAFDKAFNEKDFEPLKQLVEKGNTP